MALTAGNGAYLPSSGDFWLAYNNGSGTIRLFKVTARSTDTLTVVAVSGEGSGDGNISSGETLRWALTYDALVQLREDIRVAGGLVLLESHTASASSSLDFTTCITTAHDDYLIEIIQLIPATDNVELNFRVSTDGGSTYVSTGSYSHMNFGYSAGGTGVISGTAQTSIKLIGGVNWDNNSNWGVDGNITLRNPGGSIYKQVLGSLRGFVNGDIRSAVIVSGAYEAATAVNAFRFLFSSGNIASGTIRCYGLAK